MVYKYVFVPGFNPNIYILARGNRPGEDMGGGSGEGIGGEVRREGGWTYGKLRQRII